MTPTCAGYAKLLQEAKKLPIQELRVDEADGLEFVIDTKHSGQLHSALESFFGAPFKPAGQDPSKEAEKYTADLGGIFSNQTLYYAKGDDFSGGAMIWPWNDGSRATVKIFRS